MIKNFNSILEEGFKLSAWGPTPEHHRRIEEMRLGIESSIREATEGLVTFQNVCADGVRAHALGNELVRRLNSVGNTPETQAWLAEIVSAADPRTKKHLEIQQQKALQYQADKKARFEQQAQKKQPYRSALEPVYLAAGAHHPNSLRHLSPCDHWKIYIDETGTSFDHNAQELSDNDKTLGRLVALAIPAGVKLTPLPKTPFHATDCPADLVDGVVQSLLEKPVGIFGFTVKDDGTQSSVWIGHVMLLVRWVLAQLPLDAEKITSVEIFIEQNCGYKPTDDLRALKEILESDLRSLSSRFNGLRLTLKFMSKNEPRNGYVDTIAFTWGSPAAESKDRLKKTAWLGHCLLRPSDAAPERIYAALMAGQDLPANEWYELCAAQAQEPQAGLLSDFLAQLGEKAKKNAAHWGRCLDEVRQRIRTKNYRLSGLAAALNWLERYAPADLALSKGDAFMLQTALLAAENHHGHIDHERLLDCIELGKSLRDEMPAEVCEAMLRIAVATTNAFQFEAMTEEIVRWTQEPIGVPGLLNYGKLYSTLGQLEAFQGRPASAVGYFDQAISHFERLSNPSQKRKEQGQTQIYRLIAQMDDPQHDVEASIQAVVDHFCALTGKKTPEEISRSIAYFGQEKRFEQYLWLRFLVTYPEPLASARKAYLELANQWQVGEDHPWPLISAYRGWLLCLNQQRGEATVTHFSAAVALCLNPENGPVLHWMGMVLWCVSQALSVGVEDALFEQIPADLKAKLPDAPHTAVHALIDAISRGEHITHQALLEHLRRCLPFNFH